MILENDLKINVFLAAVELAVVSVADVELAADVASAVDSRFKDPALQDKQNHNNHCLVIL